MAVPLEKPVRQRPVLGLPPIAGGEISDGSGFVFQIMWLDRLGNKGWRESGDAEPWRRDMVVRALRTEFGRCVDAKDAKKRGALQ